MQTRAVGTEPPASRLQLYLLGQPRWQATGSVSAELSAKDAAMLAKLALDGPQSRLALCELVWPVSRPAQAAASLRQRASRLRAEAGVPLVEIGATVALPSESWVDVSNLTELSDDELLTSPGLLAGVDLGDHDELDRWLNRARVRVAERCAKELSGRCEALEREGRLHESLRLAARVIELLPLAEQGWRRVMRLQYLRGDRAAAQEAYWRLNALLRAELGVRPSPETEQLFQTVETSETTPLTLRRPVPVSLLRPPLLIGRRDAWAAMVEAWQARRPFVLVGDGGLGKSRLLEAFTTDQPALVAARGRPGDQQLSYGLLGRLLLEIEQRFKPDATPSLRAELVRLQPRFGDQPAVRGNEAVLRHAVEEWLANALAHGLRSIVVDDLQHIDLASLDMLRWLAASPALAELRMGLASRPWSDDEAGMRMTAWLSDSHRPERIVLQPLTQRELAELLASLALPLAVDEGIVAQLFRHAGGHPLYTLATLQHAVVNDIRLQQPLLFELPDSVHALLDARVRSLPAAARDLLQVAAVGGADLSVERAAHVLARTPLALSEAWASLEACNVLQGESFSHDLVHDAALRSVPNGIRQALHRQWAGLLEGEKLVEHARAGWHWEQGTRWAEAGRAWQLAARSARIAGRLAEQTDLFERAARSHGRIGDRRAQCDALLERLEGLHLQRGGSAVLAALTEAEALAADPLQRLRCRVERTEALIEQGHAGDAVAEARAALDDCQTFPQYAIEVRAQLAKALAQRHQPDEALAHATQAIEEARAQDMPAERLKAANALMYVHWSAGRLADAVAAQREELSSADVVGDQALAAASEGSLAALLAAVGDVPGTYAHGTRAHRRQLDVGLAAGSTQLVLNHVVTGAAAAALGRFDDALDLLRQALALAGPSAPVALRAKAGLSLANVWLTLGRTDLARMSMADLPSDLPPGMQMQAMWLQARAAQIEGTPADVQWARFDRLVAAHADLPFVQGVAFEASWRGEPRDAIAKLAEVRDACDALGLRGTARALLWRELARWLELDDAQATASALACAQTLAEHAIEGLNAKCYPPETLLSMATAYARAGDEEREGLARKRARDWIEAAVVRVPSEFKDAFLRHNPVNRSFL